MTIVTYTAAISALIVGILQLRKAWRTLSTIPPLSAVSAIAGLAGAMFLFCLGFGVALGSFVGLFAVGLGGIATSAAAADLGAPKLLVRTSAAARPQSTACRRIARVWRFVLAAPVSLSAGIALGLVALATGPGEAADQLVFSTLTTIIGSSALIAWTASDPDLGRATLVGSGTLAIAVAAAWTCRVPQ